MNVAIQRLTSDILECIGTLIWIKNAISAQNVLNHSLLF